MKESEKKQKKVKQNKSILEIVNKCISTNINQLFTLQYL